MKKQIKSVSKPRAAVQNLNIYRGGKNMKNGFLLILIISIGISCSKSSSTPPPPPPPECLTNSCLLMSHNWRISSSTIYTDNGNYSSNSVQLSTIPWATFFFKPDSIVTLTSGQGNYTYTDSIKSLVLIFNALPLHFTITSLSKTSLAFSGKKIQMNPQTDSGAEATYAIKSIGGDLHDNYGVDTSKIHYIQVSFSYY